jgi:hypothetical protein
MRLRNILSSLGLNTSTFNSCLDSKKYSSTLDKDRQEGSSYGTSGTLLYWK